MITLLGAAFALLVGFSLIFRISWLPWILSASVPFSATAGFTVAGQSIVIYNVVAIIVVIVMARRHGLIGILEADLARRPGLRPLIAFGLWTLAVTAIVPTVFAGIKVIDPRRGIDVAVIAPSDLAPSISNFAQAGYLIIGIATVLAFASTSRLSPLLPAAGFAVGTALSTVHSFLPDSANTVLFDNSQNVAYISGEFDGIERMRGIFSEPSGLGAFSLAAMLFFLLSMSRVRGVKRLLFLILAIWALTNAVLSFSGGALVSGFTVLFIVGAQRLYSYARGRIPMSPVGLVSIIVGGATTVVIAPTVYAFSALLFTDKTNSSSYENRSAADQFSYGLPWETMGLGVGVGSNRPSSFAASLVAAVGLPGTLLFVAALVTIVLTAMRRREYYPVAAALVSVMVSKLFAGPDTSEPLMWFLLAVCASATLASRPFGMGVELHRRPELSNAGPASERGTNAEVA